MCAEASPETLRFAALKRSADASLVGSAYASPDSASLRNAKYRRRDSGIGFWREDLFIPEAYNQIIAELADSGGFYGCKMEPLRKYMNHLVAIQSGD